MKAMQRFDELSDFFSELADRAAAAILPHFRTTLDVGNKDHSAFDPVTVADEAAERAIRDHIAARFPDHGILGEEYGDHLTDAEYVWVIDPIDGTRSFIAGLPVWGTLVGLKHWGRPVFGMMAQPFIGELFMGDGERSLYTGRSGTAPLKTRSCSSLSDATLLTTSPKIFSEVDGEAYLRIEREARLARYGCDCYAYAMLAAGQVDVVVESGLKAFDIMPLIPVIEGAGGVVTNWQGGSAVDGGQVAASGDRRLHETVLKRLQGI